MELSVADMEA
jgi:hypothetical protein